MFNISEGEITISNTITRRAALTGTAAGAAAIVAGTGPALADTDHGRAEWLALWHDWQDAQYRHMITYNALDEAEASASEAYPDKDFRWMTVITRTTPGAPDVHTWSPGYSHIYHKPYNHTAPSIEGYYDDIARIADSRGGPMDLEDWRAASMEDFAAWEAECRAVDERFNVPALKAVAKEAGANMTAADLAILERPARSIVGIAVKLAIGREGSGKEIEAACESAMELAGLPAGMGLGNMELQS